MGNDVAFSLERIEQSSLKAKTNVGVRNNSIYLMVSQSLVSARGLMNQRILSQGQKRSKSLGSVGGHCQEQELDHLFKS